MQQRSLELKGFELSTDYKALWELINAGHRIPAWIVYTDEYADTAGVIWDIVEVRFRNKDYSIGVRGIGYSGIEEGFEGFKMTCESRSLHFIVPKSNIQNGK